MLHFYAIFNNRKRCLYKSIWNILLRLICRILLRLSRRCSCWVKNTSLGSNSWFLSPSNCISAKSGRYMQLFFHPHAPQLLVSGIQILCFWNKRLCFPAICFGGNRFFVFWRVQPKHELFFDWTPSEKFCNSKCLG